MTRQYFEIGKSYATLTNVESLTSQQPNMAPSVEYRAYQEVINLASMQRRGVGLPSFIWTWGYIYSDMFNALRILIPGASASLHIRTRKENQAETTAGNYLYYTAVAVWPELESYEYRAGIYQPFQIAFLNPTVYTP